MDSRPLLASLPFLLPFLSGCAAFKPVPNPLLAPSSVEIRGDTAIYRGHYRVGGVRSEVTLVRGVLEGSIRQYFADSVLEMESRYRDGKAEGEAVTYFPNGRRRRVEYHAGDSLQPERTVEFDSTGSRISEWRPEGRLGTGSLVLLRDGRLLPIGDTSGKPRFVRAVVDRVQDWKFEPLERGEALDVVTVPFTFSE